MANGCLRALHALTAIIALHHEPRLFSFNSPQGACKTCNGLGVKRVIDPEKIITNPSLSLAGGAIRGWDSRHSYFYQTVEALADTFSFSLDTPFEALPDSIKTLLLYGYDEAPITFRYTTHRGNVRSRKKYFEGFIRTMERRYQETDSEAVRKSLQAYLTYCPCPDCEGTRLNHYARSVYLHKTCLTD